MEARVGNKNMIFEGHSTAIRIFPGYLGRAGGTLRFDIAFPSGMTMMSPTGFEFTYGRRYASHSWFRDIGNNVVRFSKSYLWVYPRSLCLSEKT